MPNAPSNDSGTVSVQNWAAADAILDRAAEAAAISPAAMVKLLESPTPNDLNKLFAAARQARDRHFGNTVFLYGFLYVSTYCRNHCRFCLYRRNNHRAIRYRKTLSQISESARHLVRAGVHLIDLTAGEDPCFYGHGEDAFTPIVDTVRSIRKDTGLPLMISVGKVADTDLERLAAAGAEWYACYQETHNRHLFNQLRAGQSYRSRYRSKVLAKAKGLLVEEGLLCGAGETPADLVHSLVAMARLGADQVRAMTFVPQPGTPMQDRSAATPLRELVMIALMRLVFPHLLVPASLDVNGLAGLRERLDAGANVVTSLVPPNQGLAGVAQRRLDIEAGRRTVAHVTRTLEACNLAPATRDQYLSWIRLRKGAAVLADERDAAKC
ncbi:MAG: methylornithine synthase PylB [Desulfosarcina sp.]|jgi:methylornithine synthase